MKRMIFWGAAGHAKVLRDCMRDTDYRLVALFDSDRAKTSPFPDVPVFHGRDGFEEWRRSAGDEACGFLVAVGGGRGRDRVTIGEYLQERGLTALTARHSTAYVAAGAELGPGCQVLAQATVGVDAILGQQCIVNTGAIVDHECRIGDGSHIAPGAHLAGCVEVGAYAMIGTGAVILPRVRIGDGAIVGAGAVVVNDVADGMVVVGNPARVLRENAVADTDTT